MITRNKAIFISYNHFVDIEGEEYGNINMEDYHDSFNFIIGSDNTTLNLLDNEFMNIKAYEIDHNWDLQPSTNVKLK